MNDYDQLAFNRIVIELQGRHVSPQVLLRQLEAVIRQIREGHLEGESCLDHFGFRFRLCSSHDSIFAGEPKRPRRRLAENLQFGKR